jgi:hypothetical protein
MAIRFVASSPLNGAIVSSDFPLAYNKSYQQFYFKYFPVDHDSNSWSVYSYTICKEVSQGINVLMCNFFLPIIAAPTALNHFIEENFLMDVEIDSSNETFTLYAKINANGEIVGLKFHNKVVLGTGFLEDPDWVPLMYAYVKSSNANNIPLMMLSNEEGKYLLILTYEDDGNRSLWLYDMSYAEEFESSFLVQSDINTLQDIQYSSDIIMKNFSYYQSLRESYLEDELVGRITFVTR